MPCSFSSTVHALCLCALAVATSLLSSCDSETPVAKASKENILIVGNSAEPAGLDPQVVTGVIESNIIRALFEGLCVEDPEKDGNSLPGAAASWEPNEDFTVWTFHLQPEGKWSDGEPVTAEDFVFAYERILSPDFAAKYATMLYFIKGAEAFNKKETTDFSTVGVKAVDPLTLEVTTRAPIPFLPELTKHYTWFPVPKHIILKYGTIAEKHTAWTEPGKLVSNGAFKLAEWKFNYYVSVDRNEYYWDYDTVSLAGIRYLPIGNSYTEARMYFDEQIHVTYGLAPEMIDYSRDNYPESLRQEPYLGVNFVRCNVTQPGLKDARVRKALALAIDQQSIIDNVLKGGQLPAYGLVPPMGDYVTPKEITFDPAKAKQLLAEAGFPNGEGFPKISLLTTDKDVSKRLSEAYQDMWKKHLGINVAIKQQEWKTYLDSMHKLNYDMAIGGWIGDYPDPTTFLEMWRKDDGNNNTGWHSEDYEALLKKGELAPTPAARLTALAEAEQLFLDDMPVLPIYWYTTNYLLHPSVKGWHPLILNNHPFKFISIDHGEAQAKIKKDDKKPAETSN
ncbi:oligopeptide ABC transporter substrate-binding protein OppA [Oceaniferula spumae]|uniref:Oligopeptide ABC transporter substrate-binding protein OppA n=1 Tax=Oceaniferula spumae TaxID=2979115 RepID=A0AAT9FJ83_9BACT